MNTQNKARARSVTSREWLALAILAETAAHKADLSGNTTTRDYYLQLAHKCDEQSEEALNTTNPPKQRNTQPLFSVPLREDHEAGEPHR